MGPAPPAAHEDCREVRLEGGHSQQPDRTSSVSLLLHTSCSLCAVLDFPKHCDNASLLWKLFTELFNRHLIIILLLCYEVQKCGLNGISHS